MSGRRTVITINFAGTDFRFVRRARNLTIGLAVALVLLAIVLVGLGARYRAQAAATAQEVKTLQAAQEKVQPLIREREQLVRNLGEMAALIEARRFSWTRLLTAIEGVFPPGVALSRLEFDPREQMVSLEGEAHSPEALSELMIGLQRTAILRNPLLKRQSMEKGKLSFHVIVRYHEAPAS